MMDLKKIVRKLQTITDDAGTLEKSVVLSYLDARSIPYSDSSFFKNYFSLEDLIIADKTKTLLSSDAPISLEDLIGIFEYLVPSDQRKGNGVVYTPENIRSYIVESIIDQKSPPKVCDPSCGCGSFLITAAEHMHEKYKLPYSRLLTDYLFGIDIDPEAIRKTKLLFNVLALSAGEELPESINLICADSIDKRTTDRLLKQTKGGFDCIIGNPPYVRSRNMSSSVKEKLIHWDTAKSGNVDLYIPFYEVGIGLLNDGGRLGYISPNTFIQSVNGRSLRNYFKAKEYDLTILDFRETQVFKDVTSYTCIVIADKRKKASMLHYALLNGKRSLYDYVFTDYSLNDFKEGSPWRLCNEQVDTILRKIETTGKPLNDYKIRNGLATLKNDIYFFTPTGETDDCYVRIYDGIEHKIEKELCIDVVKPNILKNEEDLSAKKEKAIFPYISKKNQYEIIPEKELTKKYPNAHEFFLSVKGILENRDKGNGKYPSWYAYGRMQGVNNHGKKLLIPYMAGMPIAVISTDEDLLFYCGYAVFSDDEQELQILKRFLESSVFWYYILHTSKPYSKGFMAFAKNYIKDFSVPQLSDEQIKFLLSSAKKSDIDNWMWRLYGVEPISIPMTMGTPE